MMSYKKRTLKIFSNCKMANTTNLDEENPNHEEVPDAKENAASGKSKF